MWPLVLVLLPSATAVGLLLAALLSPSTNCLMRCSCTTALASATLLCTLLALTLAAAGALVLPARELLSSLVAAVLLAAGALSSRLGCGCCSLVSEHTCKQVHWAMVVLYYSDLPLLHQAG